MKNTIRLLATLLPLVIGCKSDSGSNLSPQSGQGGSMARFAITGNSLYIVDNSSLNFYDISAPENPKKGGSKEMGFGIETIFPYQSNLFIGASDGLYIFDNSDPSNPQLITKYWHIQSCDPVVVQGDYAYVTLRGGTACRVGNATGSLDVIDISDLSNPKLIRTQTMSSPYGLGVSGQHLFVCEGDNGLKVFNLSNPKVPVLASNHPEIPSYDVIVRNSNSLILTGKEGIFQFGYEETPGKLTLLSRIPVE